MVEDAHHFFITIYAASVSGGMEINMKKGILLVSVLAIMILSACGDNADDKIVIEVNADNDIGYSLSDPLQEDIITDEDTTITMGEAQDISARDKYLIVGSRSDLDVSEGTLLCHYKILEDDTEEYLGIINRNVEFIPCEIEHSYSYSSFSKGYAYINYPSYMEKSPEAGTFIIVNERGEIVYKSPSDAEYSIECGGDGYYFVKKEVKGFDVNECLYGIISADGTWILEPEVLDDEYTHDIHYRGNRVLELGFGSTSINHYWGYSKLLIDMKNLNEYYIESYDQYDPQYAGLTEDGRLVWSHSDSWEGEIYITDVNGNTTQIASTGGYGYAKYGEDLVFVNDNDGQARYIDLDGNVVIDLSQYDIVREYALQYFNVFIDGLAAFDMIGQDGSPYFVIINKAGEFVFDPIKHTETNSTKGYGTLSEGYIPILTSIDTICFVDQKGNKILFNCEFSHKDEALKSITYMNGRGYDKRFAYFIDMDGNEIPLKIGQ